MATTISALPNATTLTNENEFIPVVQDSTTRKLTPLDLGFVNRTALPTSVVAFKCNTASGSVSIANFVMKDDSGNVIPPEDYVFQIWTTGANGYFTNVTYLYQDYTAAYGTFEDMIDGDLNTCFTYVCDTDDESDGVPRWGLYLVAIFNGPTVVSEVTIGWPTTDYIETAVPQYFKIGYGLDALCELEVTGPWAQNETAIVETPKMWIPKNFTTDFSIASPVAVSAVNKSRIKYIPSATNSVLGNGDIIVMPNVVFEVQSDANAFTPGPSTSFDVNGAYNRNPEFGRQSTIQTNGGAVVITVHAPDNWDTATGTGTGSFDYEFLNIGNNQLSVAVQGAFIALTAPAGATAAKGVRLKVTLVYDGSVWLCVVSK